jgi:Tol biopolymer transport system component
VDLASGEPTEPVVVSAGSDVVDEAIVSADGSNIAFSAASGGGLPQLYLARRTEDTWAAPVQLNPALREGGQVHAGAQFSPDGRKVFFIASDGPEGLRRAFEIDLVRDEPGTAVLLSGEDAVGGLHVLPE